MHSSVWHGAGLSGQVYWAPKFSCSCLVIYINVLPDGKSEVFYQNAHMHKPSVFPGKQQHLFHMRHPYIAGNVLGIVDLKHGTHDPSKDVCKNTCSFFVASVSLHTFQQILNRFWPKQSRIFEVPSFRPLVFFQYSHIQQEVYCCCRAISNRKYTVTIFMTLIVLYVYGHQNVLIAGK